MAKITLGMASAYGPQIFLPPDSWELRVEADRQNKDHWFRGNSPSTRLLTVASGGTAEIKSWMPVYGAMAQLGAPMTVVDYVPCYRHWQRFCVLEDVSVKLGAFRNDMPASKFRAEH